MPLPAGASLYTTYLQLHCIVVWWKNWYSYANVSVRLSQECTGASPGAKAPFLHTSAETSAVYSMSVSEQPENKPGARHAFLHEAFEELESMRRSFDKRSGLYAPILRPAVPLRPSLHVQSSLTRPVRLCADAEKRTW